MSEAAKYSRDEEAALRRAVADGEEARCPRCAAAMTRRSIGGGSFGLGYARRREWYICPSCHRSVIFDLRRGTRN
jgi:transposase-like protein